MTVFLPKKLLIEAAMLEYSHIISFNLTLTCHCARFKHSIKTKKLQSETGASGVQANEQSNNRHIFQNCIADGSNLNKG